MRYVIILLFIIILIILLIQKNEYFSNIDNNKCYRSITSHIPNSIFNNSQYTNFMLHTNSNFDTPFKHLNQHSIKATNSLKQYIADLKSIN